MAEHLHHFGLARRHGPRRGPQLGPLAEEALHDVDVPAGDGAVQGPHAVHVHVLDEGAPLQQQRDQRRAALEGAQVQRAAPRAVRVVHVGAAVQEELCGLQSAPQAGPRQSCHAVLVFLLDTCS